MLLVLSAVTACQPMYDGKAQKLKTPDEVGRPADVAGSAEPKPPKLDDNCGTDPVIPSKTPVSIVTAEATRKRTEALRETGGEKRAQLAAEAVDKYRDALAKDPYNLEATLGLAVAYDLLRRKQCALTMLSRIVTLAQHPPFTQAASDTADEVKRNGSWFKHYRNEAQKAVGR